MTDRKAIKRTLNAAGYVHLTPGWVREADAKRLQAQIDRAVQSAADDVATARIRAGNVGEE